MALFFSYRQWLINFFYGNWNGGEIQIKLGMKITIMLEIKKSKVKVKMHNRPHSHTTYLLINLT